MNTNSLLPVKEQTFNCRDNSKKQVRHNCMEH
jgi:hypothetical protein